VTEPATEAVVMTSPDSATIGRGPCEARYRPLACAVLPVGETVFGADHLRWRLAWVQ